MMMSVCKSLNYLRGKLDERIQSLLNVKYKCLQRSFVKTAKPTLVRKYSFLLNSGQHRNQGLVCRVKISYRAITLIRQG